MDHSNFKDKGTVDPQYVPPEMQKQVQSAGLVLQLVRAARQMGGTEEEITDRLIRALVVQTGTQLCFPAMPARDKVIPHLRALLDRHNELWLRAEKANLSQQLTPIPSTTLQ